MLRILVFDEPFSVKLRLEGELTGQTAPQLTQRWAEVRSRLQNRRAILDLGDVVKVDGAGRDTLAWLSDAGVRFGYAHPGLSSLMIDLARRKRPSSSLLSRLWNGLRAKNGFASLLVRLYGYVCSALPPGLRPCGCRPH